MKSLLLYGAVGGGATWFLWKTHKTLAYITAALTVFALYKNWRG